MKKKFKFKKGESYDGGDDELLEWIIYNTTEDDENGFVKYKNNYEVIVDIRKC